MTILEEHTMHAIINAARDIKRIADILELLAKQDGIVKKEGETK